MDASSKFLLLREYPIFKTLSESEMNWLAQKANFKTFRKNEHIYGEGEEAKCVYLVEKGSVKLSINSDCGKVLIKDIIHKENIFGENVFSGTAERKEAASVMSNDVSVFMISKEHIKELVNKNYHFAQEMVNVILKRLRIIERRMENYIFKKAKSRIVDFILQTGKLRGIKIGLDECLINHGMSHKEIAYLTDTSRQTVARVLGELKRENLIHFSTRKPSKILIRNLANLSV